MSKGETSDGFGLAFGTGLCSNWATTTPGSTQPSSSFLGAVTPTEAQISLPRGW